MGEGLLLLSSWPINLAQHQWLGRLRTPKYRTPSVAPGLAFKDEIVSGFMSSVLQGESSWMIVRLL